MSDSTMIAERLKLIRQARNMSLEELSAAMEGHVTKQALSKYEMGKDRPSPGVLRRLASALGVAASALIEAPGFQVQPVEFRKAAKLGKKLQVHYESLLTMNLEQAMRLRDLVEPSSCFNVPVLYYSAATLEEAETAANRLREDWKLGEDPIPSLVDVLEAAGVLVVETGGDDSFSGLSAVAHSAEGKPCGAAVMVHRGVCLERQRLTLAHELAHVVLKVPEGVDGEVLAFRFGGAFLCPAKTLRSDVGGSRSRVLIQELHLLRRRYGMSMQALLRRMLDLSIIPSSYHKDRMIYFSKMRWRQQEPGQTEQGETPQWMERTVYRALGEGLITRDQANDLIGKEVDGEQADTFVDALRKMNPNERERLIEAHIAAHPSDDQELDEEWMNTSMEGEA